MAQTKKSASTSSARKSTRKRKKSVSRSKKDSDQVIQTGETYNVDVDAETGVMKLPEIHYYRLIVAEQQIRLRDQSLRIVKSELREFQVQVDIKTKEYQSRIKELTELLTLARAGYFSEARAVEEATGLKLKNWTIQDDRTLRPIEEKEPPKK